MPPHQCSNFAPPPPPEFASLQAPEILNPVPRRNDRSILMRFWWHQVNPRLGRTPTGKLHLDDFPLIPIRMSFEPIYGSEFVITQCQHFAANGGVPTPMHHREPSECSQCELWCCNGLDALATGQVNRPIPAPGSQRPVDEHVVHLNAHHPYLKSRKAARTGEPSQPGMRSGSAMSSY